MIIDATFWVMVSFFIFIGLLAYFQIPQKIKSTLEESGYETTHNKNKMYFSLGPFADMSHAVNESKKLKKIHSINSKVIDFVF